MNGAPRAAESIIAGTARIPSPIAVTLRRDDPLLSPSPERNAETRMERRNAVSPRISRVSTDIPAVSFFRKSVIGGSMSLDRSPSPVRGRAGDDERMSIPRSRSAFPTVDARPRPC